MNAANEVWETYASAWKAEGAEAKRAALTRSVEGGAVYRDPLAECEGHEALIAYMLDFHQQVPGGHFETTYFLAHHGRSVAKWNMRDGQGRKIGDGVSFGEYAASGQLVAMTGFFDVAAGS
ncbi:nuclear transport factor 2 family protein [Ideonella sp. DXS29W]|uniref:Nuclear transport factor 2 family protein n=1 Tax=Ideonella lacteola TaxID=2984193 RepID=A0ABU9BV01_9BURK